MATQARTTEEVIVLSLSGLIVIALTPFVVIRLAQANWEIAILDATAIAISLGIFTYVYTTRKTRAASVFLAALCYPVLIATVRLGGVAQIYWAYPALTGVFFLIAPRLALLLSSLSLLLIGALVWGELDIVTGLKFYISTFGTLLFSYTFAEKMLEQKQRLLDIVDKDPLTGACNRRAMERKLHEIHASQRTNPDLTASLLVMDLDNFKGLNQKYGHSIGDLVLAEFVRAIHKNIDGANRLYRTGGEEFLIVIDTADPEEVRSICESLHHAVATDETLKLYDVSMSVGAAPFRCQDTTSDWFGRADNAMYKAKCDGRRSTYIA